MNLEAGHEPQVQMQEVHPIDMLVDLVISDEMDPWQIDIAEIAHRFLEQVRGMEKINLRLSGKTLLAASVLLKMKSEVLLPKEEPQVLEESGWDIPSREESQSIIPLSIPLRRRAERKATLFELIAALQRALSEEMIRRNFPREPRTPAKLVIKIDEEGIREKMLKIYERIQNLARLKEVIKFSELIGERTRSGIVEVFLCLLFLDSQRKIKIWQEELFGEIFITVK